jgi:hypothetical protein
MTDYFEFVRKNAESRWARDLRDLDGDVARCVAAPAKLRNSPFSYLHTGVLAWGPSRIAEVAPRIAPLVKPAIDALGAKESKSFGELGIASLANLLACCGYADETPLMSEWLWEIRTYRHDEDVSPHWTKGFAALALDVKKLYRTHVGAEPDEALTMTPSALFGGNLQGLLRHLAGSVETGASVAEVEPAWRDFVANLNRHEDTRQIDRATPFWIARVVHHRIGRAPLGSVAQWLHEEIQR